MCGIIGYVSKGGKSIQELFEKEDKEILDRGIYFDKLILENKSYGYSRLPTDSISNDHFNLIHRKKKGVPLYDGLVTNMDYLCERYLLSKEARKFDTRCLLHEFSHKEQIESIVGRASVAVIGSKIINIMHSSNNYQKEVGDFLKELNMLK